MNCNEVRGAAGLPARARLGLAALLLTAAGAATAAPISVTIVGPSAPVAANSTFTLDLRVAGLGPQVPLSGYDFSLRYDGALVSYQSATFSTALGGAAADYADGPAATAFSTGGGRYVNLLAVSALFDDELLSRQPDDGFSLLTLVFRATGAGTASFGLELLGLPGALQPPGFLGGFDAAAGDIDVLEATLGGARVTIAPSVPVPEPGSASLVLALALVAAASRAARRRQG
jgi:hypothetical protein